MQIYKRTIWVMIKGLVTAPFSGLVVYVVARWLFTDSDLWAGGAAALTFLVLLCITIFGENVYFELMPNGILRYYKRGTLRSSHDVTKCVVSYHRESVTGFMGTDDITLLIQEEGKEKVEIDCSPLGPSRFDKMFEKLEALSQNKPEILRAEPKSKKQIVSGKM